MITDFELHVVKFPFNLEANSLQLTCRKTWYQIQIHLMDSKEKNWLGMSFCETQTSKNFMLHNFETCTYLEVPK